MTPAWTLTDKLKPTGAASRDRLVRERLRLHAARPAAVGFPSKPPVCPDCKVRHWPFYGCFTKW